MDVRKGNRYRKKFTKEDFQKIVEKSPYYKATSNDVDFG